MSDHQSRGTHVSDHGSRLSHMSDLDRIMLTDALVHSGENFFFKYTIYIINLKDIHIVDLNSRIIFQMMEW